MWSTSVRSAIWPRNGTGWSPLRWQHFDAKRLGSTVGAELAGVDLTADLPDEVIAEIRQALYDYKVLFFRDQPLTPEQHVAFARRFGGLEVHPFLPSNTGEPELVRFEKTAEVTGYENSWHHDVTWRESPSMGAVLHALSVPDIGGDTLFSDMYAAYDVLDDETKAEIDELTVAVHDFTQTFGHGMTKEERREAKAQYPQVRHPVVCTHPGTGKLHLYVNRPFTSHIEGLEPRRQPRTARSLVPPGRRARAPVPVHVDEGRGRLLGQPSRPALRIERLLAAPADHGARVDRREPAGSSLRRVRASSTRRRRRALLPALTLDYTGARRMRSAPSLELQTQFPANFSGIWMQSRCENV